MDKISAIASTSFREVVRKKVSYIIGLIAVLTLVSIFSQAVFFHMAVEAGEMDSAQRMQAESVSNLFGTWGFGAMVLAIFMGAVAVSSEIKARTIVVVLARPVDRWAYLLGRWMGIIGYLACFLAIGIGAGLWLIHHDGLTFAPLFWVGVVELFVTAFFYSGVSVGLGAIMSPTLAGICALLISFLPAMAKQWMEHPNPLLRALSFIGYYLGPAQMPVNAINDSFGKVLVAPDYRLYLGVLLENFLYAIVIFAIGCFVFSRREPKLR